MKEIGLEGKLTGQQAAKKWENLKQKYKVCDVRLRKKKLHLQSQYNAMNAYCMVVGIILVFVVCPSRN